MRKISAVWERCRVRNGHMASKEGDPFGAFVVVCPGNQEALRVIVAPADHESWRQVGFAGDPWDHVSVSCRDACPTWDSMAWVKDQLWEPETCVVQFHPPRSVYRNVHPHCLHLWALPGYTFPLPPPEAVA